MPDHLIRKRPSDSSSIYYRPLIPLLLAFIAGLFCTNHLADRFNEYLWPAAAVPGCILVSAGILIFRISRRRNVTLVPLILFFSLGVCALIPWLPSAYYRYYVTPYVSDETQWEISGTVSEPILYQKFRTVCILGRLQLSPIHTEASPKRVRGKIRAVIYGKPASLQIGDRLTVKGKIRPFRNFKNAGAFDYIKYMMFQGVWGNVYTGSKNTAIQKAGNRLFRWVTDTSQRISQMIEHSCHGDARAILKALILGNRQEISRPLREAFNQAGISHLLAISGLHIGIVASFSFFFFTSLLSHSGFLLRHAWTRKGAAVLSLVPVLVYGIMAGMSPSTQRAVIMVSVFLMTFLIGREHDLMNTLSVAALLILVIHPPALFSISFQLSFAAVLSIIFGLSRIPRPHKRPERLPAAIVTTAVTFILISCLAIIGTAPLTMRYFNQISLAGIFSNLIFVPLIGFAVVPAGLFSALVLLPVWPTAAGWGFDICNMILTTAIDWIYWISSLPYAAVKTVTPSTIEIICLYALIGSSLYLIGSDSDADTEKIPDFCRQIGDQNNKETNLLSLLTPASGFLLGLRPYKTRALIILGITLTVLSVDVVYWVQKRLWKNDLTVSILDVGQGNSALIQMPGGQCALIDGGGYTDNSIFDIGERVVAPFLWRKKIKTIETVILTHYDADHLNGLIYILKHFNVRRVIAPYDRSTSSTHHGFTEIINAKQIDYPEYRVLPKIFNINGVRFHILYPPENFSLLSSSEPWRNSNNNSLVVKVTFGDYSILFPGDIMKEAENELVKSDRDLRATVMLAPHHGSNSSSQHAFINHVAPKYAIISCGTHNRFKFPSPEVLNHYEESGIRTFRTDTNGQIDISTDGRKMILIPMTGDRIEETGKGGERVNASAEDKATPRHACHNDIRLRIFK